MDLKNIGWNSFFEKAFSIYDNDIYLPGRITAEYTHCYKVYTEDGEMLGEITGKMRFKVQSQEDYPAVGDWVVVSRRPGEEKVNIHAVLPRKSKFSRTVAGKAGLEQIVASNVDTIFIVSSLNKELNLRRMERYLTAAWESGAMPVIILTKADLCENVEDEVLKVQAIAAGVPVYPVSAFKSSGINPIYKYLTLGKTTALLGSSGVGKSTLINLLAGKELLETNEVSEFMDKGRHTTTHREIIVLPTGGIIIDTPGMRELQLWDGDISETFEDIKEIAKWCRFRDCKHEMEPGCAVRAAIESGEIEEKRLESFNKIQKELAFLERKQKHEKRLIEKRNMKEGSKTRREMGNQEEAGQWR